MEKNKMIKEKKAWALNGYLGLIVLAVCALLFVTLLITELTRVFPSIFLIIVYVLMLIICWIFATAITIVGPNQAKVLTFFGQYLGTIRKNGLFITVPFTFKQNISLKVRNFNSNKIKVNDIDGNPIEIAAVVVFRVVDTAKALFDVQYYENFVEIQSETAIRYVATKYPYDSFVGDEITLRGHVTEISEELTRELQERLDVAGVEIIEARLSHLAYSTEIASSMLQRQQAKAILSARKLIVEGAVSMSQDALEQLEANSEIKLSEAARVQLINNLLVSIISDKGVQPTLNVEDHDTL